MSWQLNCLLLDAHFFTALNDVLFLQKYNSFEIYLFSGTVHWYTGSTVIDFQSFFSVIYYDAIPTEPGFGLSLIMF